MSEIDQMWLPQKPNLIKKPKSPFVSGIFFGFLFFTLITVAIAVVYFMPQLNPAVQILTTSVQVPDLLPNCAFFYQQCPTSSEGIVTLQSVDNQLNRLNSPLQQAGPLLHPEIDSEMSQEVPPSEIMTLIAAKYDVNPFLLLTLSEMDLHLVTLPRDLKPVIESAGDQSGQAWFSLQHQNLAMELQTYAQQANLSNETLEENSKLKSISVGAQKVELPGNFSLATEVILRYFAAHSTSVQDFETKVDTFSNTYKNLWGLDFFAPPVE